jgi:hypothetical protein
VQEVSAGNAYWVRLIADYVSQFGYESFMKSVGVTDSEDDLEEGGGGVTNRKSVVSRDDHDELLSIEKNENTSTNRSVSSPQTPSTNGNYAITSSFRQYGSLHLVDRQASSLNNRVGKKKNKTNKRSHQEHESNHLRVFIVSLVDQLSIEDASVLKLASLIGVTFCSRVLQQILPQNLRKPGLLESSLLSLEGKGFVIRISAEGTLYQFQNHRLREIVYDFTPPRFAHLLPPLLLCPPFDPDNPLSVMRVVCITPSPKSPRNFIAPRSNSLMKRKPLPPPLSLPSALS